ncbi:MAG: hypothetical protein AAFX94_18985 [Myxococcota bacterium]
MNASANVMSAEQMVTGTKKRTVHLRGKSGNLYGANYTIPKGDFARFLGWKPETESEASGQQKAQGWRALQIAIQKEMNQVGESAMQRGSTYRNLFIAPARYSQKPGRGEDMIADGVNAMEQSVEKGHNLNMRYLELQYKFQLAGKNFGTVSNLMKVRHESVKKAMNDVK